MTLLIENVNENLAKAIKSMAKITNAKVSVKKNNQAEEWKKETEEMIKLYKAGKLKTYENADEMERAILSEV